MRMLMIKKRNKNKMCVVIVLYKKNANQKHAMCDVLDCAGDGYEDGAGDGCVVDGHAGDANEASARAGDANAGGYVGDVNEVGVRATYSSRYR